MASEELGGSVNETVEQEEIALSTSELDNILSSAEVTSEDGDAGEETLEQYGVWVKVQPEEIALSPGDSSFELSDLDGQDEPNLTQEEEKLLGELEGDSMGSDELDLESMKVDDLDLEEDLESFDKDEITLPTAEIGTEAPEIVPDSVEDLPELETETLDLDLPEEAMDVGEIEVPLSDSNGVEESFDDLSALEDDLTESAAAAPREADILQKIEADLNDIRREIQDLKKELGGLSHAKTEEVDMALDSDQAAGFFAEEEDETIALTGDELDNILNTADITEEATESAEETLAPLPEMELEVEGSEEPLEGDLMDLGSLGVEEPLETETEEIEIEIEPREDLEIPEDLGEEISLDDETLSIADLDQDIELPVEADELELEIPESLDESIAAAEPEELELDETLDIGVEEISLEEIPEAGEDSFDLEAPEISVEESLDEDLVASTETAEELELEVEDTLEEIPEVEDVLELDLPSDDITAELPEEPVEELELEEFSDSLTAAAEGTEEGLEILDSETDLETLSLDEETEVEGVPISIDEDVIPFDETETPAIDESPEEVPVAVAAGGSIGGMPEDLKNDVKSVLSYLDQLLENLPEEKIRQFADSEYFSIYKRLFEELGLEA